MTRRAFIPLVVAIVVLTAWAIGARQTPGDPYAPDSTSPDGTKALVELIGRYADMTVTADVPDRNVDTAVLVVDRFGREGAAGLDEWVRAGGRLVVLDPASTLTPPRKGRVQGSVAVSCDAAALADVGVIAFDRASPFELGGPGCAASAGALVAVASVGEGTVVSIAGRSVFTNEWLDQADNAVLAVALLAPTPSTSAVFLAPRPPVGEGQDSLVDLLGDPARATIAQLFVVFLAVAFWRGRRLGDPVSERPVVEIEAAELTEAYGRMLANRHQPAHAGALLRDHARRSLADRLGLGTDATVSQVTAAIVRQTSLTESEAARAASGPIDDDAELVAVAALLTRLHEEILHDHVDR